MIKAMKHQYFEKGSVPESNTVSDTKNVYIPLLYVSNTPNSYPANPILAKHSNTPPIHYPDAYPVLKQVQSTLASFLKENWSILVRGYFSKRKKKKRKERDKNRDIQQKP